MPEVVVLGDNLGGRHKGDRHVGHVALESDQGLSAGQAGLIDGAVIAAGLDESCCLGFLLTRYDRPCAGFLSRQGLLLTAGPLCRVRASRPPGPVSLFGFQTGSARCLASLTCVLPCRDLTVSVICLSVKTSPFQLKWDSRSPGAFVIREPTMNDSSCSSRGGEVALRQHPCIGGHHHRCAGQVVADQEAGDDRHDRGRLSGVAFETADRQRESGGGPPTSRRRSEYQPDVLSSSRPCAANPRIRLQSRAW